MSKWLRRGFGGNSPSHSATATATTTIVLETGTGHHTSADLHTYGAAMMEANNNPPTPGGGGHHNQHYTSSSAQDVNGNQLNNGYYNATGNNNARSVRSRSNSNGNVAYTGGYGITGAVANPNANAEQYHQNDNDAPDDNGGASHHHRKSSAPSRVNVESNRAADPGGPSPTTPGAGAAAGRRSSSVGPSSMRKTRPDGNPAPTPIAYGDNSNNGQFTTSNKNNSPMMLNGQFGAPPPFSTGAGTAAQPPLHQHDQYSNANNNTTAVPPSSAMSTVITPSSSSQQQQVSSSSTSPQQPQQQQRRPAYLLHRDLVIGKGSYGQVCIASRGEAEGGRSGKRKKFACKCVMLRSDPKYIAKLQEEVNVLRELRGHENVIRLYDVFCVDNELFIITELGRGGDLFHLLTTHPKHGVTESYAAKTVAQMLSSVAFLHNRNICHRDLKLENWVLESGKDVWSPLKLIDFGLSTHFTPGHKLSRVVGSSYYVAPEVLKKSYTEACDLWSLGVIVYMLLSGAPPFYGRTDEAIKQSIVNGEYTFPHELFRDVSDDAMAFVSTLLSYNTEYRYTADQALTHPWLSANCDPELLRRAKEGARDMPQQSTMSPDDQPEPMQL